MTTPDLTAANARVAELAEDNDTQEKAGHLLATMLKDTRAQLADAKARTDQVREFIRDLATNYDHRDDAHHYGTSCYVCEAEELHKKLSASPVVAPPSARTCEWTKLPTSKFDDDRYRNCTTVYGVNELPDTCPDCGGAVVTKDHNDT